MPQPVQIGFRVGLRGRSTLADDRENAIAKAISVLVGCMVDG